MMLRNPVRMLPTAAAALALTAGPVWADDKPKLPASVTVSFGAGLNTNQPGNPANHHILPQVIRVRTGGVVNFVVAGFHQIFVYNPDVKLEDVQEFAATLPPPPAGLFINFQVTSLLYGGLAPNAPPPAGLSNAQNRVESVSFAKPGLYLVICNVAPHLRDGMFAWVRVGAADDDKEDKEHDRDHRGRIE